MELRDKKTGEICKILTVDEYGITIRNSDGSIKIYKTIAELMEEKEEFGESDRSHIVGISIKKKTVTIQYDSYDHAADATYKLNALARLMNNGFKFDGFRQDYSRLGYSGTSNNDVFRVGRKYIHFNKAEDEDWLKENWGDLTMVFGNEKATFLTGSDCE